MKNIKEILEKYAKHIVQTNKFAKFQSIPKFISSEDFDKLEITLLEYVDREVLEAIVELAYSDEGLNIEIRHKEHK